MVNLNFILSILMIFCALLSPKVHAQNGTERGGGDEYVAEFQNYKRSVMASVESWLKDGTLKLSEVDQTKFKKIAPTIKIFSLEHVYLVRNDPSTEVTLLNQKNLVPPRITLGRVRWKQLMSEGTQTEIEMMVLHELLSASKIHDSEFEKSYSTKLKQIENWRKFRNEFQQRITHLELTLLQFMNTFNLDSAKAFMDAIYLDSDYTNCMMHPGSTQSALKMQNSFCIPFSKKWTKNLPIIVKKSFARVEKIKKEIDDQSASLNQWIASYSSKEYNWYEWAFIVFYQIDLNYRQDFYNEIKQLAERRNEECQPHLDQTLSTACGKKFMENTFFPEFERLNKIANLEMKKSVETALSEIETQINAPQTAP